MLTNTQLYVLLVAPLLMNATLTGILMAYINAKNDVLRAELRRVEEVLDARLKHMEERHS